MFLALRLVSRGFFRGVSRQQRSHHWGPTIVKETKKNMIPGWWLGHPSEKYESIGMMTFPRLMGKYKMFQTTNQKNMIPPRVFQVSRSGMHAESPNHRLSSADFPDVPDFPDLTRKSQRP